MTRDGEKTNRTGVRGASEPFHDAGSREAEPPGRELLGDDQIAVSGITGIGLVDPVLSSVAPICGYHSAAVEAAVKDANDPGTRRAEHPICPSLDLTRLTQQVAQRRAAALVGPRASLGHLA